MREPWVRALLVGALALAGYGCTPDDQPACTTDGDCGDGRVCAAGACVAQPCEDGDLRACGVGGVACPGTQTCTDGVWGACEAPPEVCDGIDNDCDRRADEGFAGLGDACAFGEGECHDRGHIVCTADGQGVMCDARPSEPVEEVCNGRDDDCDGDVDEALGGGACDTGSFGACAAGAEACVDGDTRCVPEVEPSDELCDGVDNDCDGNLDEAANGGPLAEPCYDGPAGTADVGACAAGVRVCTDGMFGGCAEQVLPADEICDGVDNDCNGEADDGDVECVCVPGSRQPCYSGPAGTAGVGVCAAGSQTCADDGSAWGPCAGEVVPGLELCDGEDDDCNGVIDDAVGVNELCEVGLGACAAAGVRRCDLGSGQVVCDAEEGLPADETCNGVDDDCDGQVDDVQQVGGACEVGIGGCAVGGSLVCGPDGGVFCAAEAGQPVDEICNGVDDDCDGRIDDVPGLGEPCEVGAGRCRSTGVLVCGAEGLICGARPGAPQAEICGNRIDDDCDGEVDDDDVCGDCGNGRRDEGEGCDDGNREDGDGCDADCAVEDGFECFDGPADTAVAIDGLECEDYAPVHVPDWVGGYGVAYVGGVVQFAGDQQRFTSGYAVRTTDAEGDTSELLVGYDPERGFREADRPGLAPLFLIRRFDRLDAGDYAVRFPDVDCGDNQGTIDVEFRTLDACRPLACAADADCLFDDEVCLEGACVPADCGNGRRDAGEQCDDGNRAAGDGCDGHCQVEEGFECFAGPDESVVTLDGLGDCNVWRDVELAPWDGGYGAAYAGGAVRFGLPSRYTGRFAVRTTAGRVASVIDVGLDADGALIEADGPEAAEALFADTFVALPDGAQAVLYPDTECEDNEGTVDIAFRSLDLCRPAVCAVDADCVFADEVCVEGACGAIICGNGRRDAGESCDDGNADDGDGCSAECQVEDGFECFDGPGDTAVTVDGADCEDYAPVDVPEWAGGYGVAYIGGVVQFAGNGQRYTGSYAVRTTDVVAEEWYLWVGFDPDEGFDESHDPGRASRLLANRFDRLPDGDYAVRFPDGNCADNRGTIDLELRTLDLCQPIGCEVDADCPGIGEFCIDSVCGLRGPFCGDGDVDPGEECDDGDSEAGDGCSAICVVEPGGSCVDFTFSFGVTDSVPFDDAPAPRWTVSDDGRSITQAVNSAPAHYASDLPISADYVTRLEIRVEDPEADDDVLGWTIGGGATALSDPAAPYLLFSWKQEEQDHPVAGFAPRGLRVARVDGPVSIQDLWQVDGEHITELALGATQGDLGWIDDQTYTIDIIGDGDRMRVYVDGVLEFDLADVPLGDGHLGTYTTSQPGFSARLISPESIQICSGLEPVCGDGTIDPGEGCDDGNADDGDGCSSACLVEPDYECDDFSFAFGADDSVVTREHEAPVWQASPDGRTLTQLTNSWPAHRATNLPISTEYVVAFDMTVTSPEDDDIIGWSVGGGAAALSGTEQPYLLFSWLQDNVRHPDTGERITGLRVYLVDGVTNPGRLLYGGPNVTLLAEAATLGDTPWRNLQTYRVEVFGDSDRLEVFVDGVREFDLVDAPIGTGNLGYYVRSQLGYQVELIAPADLQACAVPEPFCGDGEVGDDEQCDDGDAEDGDGCAADCTIEPGFACADFTFAFGATDTIPAEDLPAPEWQASADGRAIAELRNAAPSHYASDLPISPDYVTRFEVSVDSANDNDIVGWTLGGGPTALSGPTGPYLLFSWKQDTQDAPGFGLSEAGLRAAVVSAQTDYVDLWQLGGDSVEQVALAETIGETGWADRQVYTIEIIGDEDRLQVFVDGAREFDLYDVPLGDRRLGLYTYSQEAFRAALIEPVSLEVCTSTEDCANGEDDNGDGAIDCDDPGCVADRACVALAEVCDSGFDEDGDGAIGCDDPDCADDPACAVAGVELCEGGLDDDGDGAIDCDDPDCADDPACGGEPCVDRFGGISPELATPVEPGAYRDVERCPGDFDDYFTVEVCTGGRLRVTMSYEPHDGASGITVSRLIADGQAEPLIRSNSTTAGASIAYANQGGAFRALVQMSTRASTYSADVVVDRCRQDPEVCDSDVDDDGDGLIDCADPDCAAVRDCVCAAPDPFEDDAIVPTLLVPGDRVTYMPMCPPDRRDRWSVYGCGEVELVGEQDHYIWVDGQSEAFQGRVPVRLGAVEEVSFLQGPALFDMLAYVPEGCEPGEVPAALAPEGESLRIAGVIDADDPLVEARCPDPAEVRYQTLRVTNDGPEARVVDFTAHFRDAPGSLAIFDEPFDGPILLDECHPDPAFGYRGILMPPGTTHSVVVFNTAAGVESNQFVLRVAEPGPPVELCHNGADDDGDGAIDCADDDCADEERCAVGGVEICNSGFDDNGDGNVDCGDRQCLDDPLCVEPAVCPGDDRYGPFVFGEPTLLGAGRFDGLITCEEHDLFATRLCADGQLIVTATGDGPLNLAVGSWDPNVLPGVNDRVEAGGTARVELHNDDLVQRVVRIFVSDPTAQPGLAFDLDVRIDGCEPLSRFEVCDNRIDDDGDGAVDCDDPACAAAAACIPEVCDSGFDDDGDNWIGCNDPECWRSPACTFEDQVFFSVASGDPGSLALSPTALYTFDAAGEPALLATIESPGGAPDGISALAHDGQDLWGFMRTALPDGRIAAALGPIDLESEALVVAGELAAREIVGAAFNGRGELWMLDRVNQELIVADGVVIDEARSIPAPAFIAEGDIAFPDGDDTRFVLTISEGGPPLMFRGDTATGAIEPIYDEPIWQLVGNGLAYGRHPQRCAPGLYGVDLERGAISLLDLATHGALDLPLDWPLPPLDDSPWVDAASGPQVQLGRIVPGCEGIFEFCSDQFEDGDRDGLSRCDDPDCVASDPICVE